MRGFWSQVFRTQGGYVNEDAGLMARQAEDAITDANSALVTFGYYTPVIVLRGESPKPSWSRPACGQRSAPRRVLGPDRERERAEAWLGSCPDTPRRMCAGRSSIASISRICCLCPRAGRA